MANNLDLNDKIKIGYWILKDPNDYSDTLKAALTLAQNIIDDSPRNKAIMLTYNVKDSTVDTIFQEQNIEIGQATNEESLNNKPFVAAFKPSQPIEIVLSPVLIQLCKNNIKEGSLGYNRLIFYIALTVLHEFSDWNFKTSKTGEIEPIEDFEYRMYEATFQLGANKETKELILMCQNQQSLLIDSPQAKKYQSENENL